MELGAKEIALGIQDLAEKIKSAYPEGKFAIVGIRSRGDEVAERILKILDADGLKPEMGVLDISLYRDDLAHLKSNPKLKGSNLPFTVDGAHIILVDDVLFTGRTIRSAIDAIMDYGRPAKIELAVLIDRGHRELPFAPDYVAHVLETDRYDYVDVKLQGSDGVDSVVVTSTS